MNGTGRLGRWSTSFVQANRRASTAIGRRLPQNRSDLQKEYEEVVGAHLGALDGGLVVDVGAGRTTHFIRFRSSRATRIVGIDIDHDEIARNEDVDERAVASADALPFADGTADLIVTRSTIEHLRDTDRFLRDVRRTLKDEGTFIGVLPSKYAPFALLNRLLPDRITRLVLAVLWPGSEGVLGFPAFYHHTYASGMRAALRRAGFDVTELRVSYRQAHYFGFFVPLYVLNAIYELIIRALKREDLAATLLFVAVKR